MLVIATTVVGATEQGGPAKVEAIAGSDVKRLTLTAKAAERLDIQTVPLSEEKIRRRVVVVAEVQENRPLGTAADSGTNTISMGAPQSAQSSGAGEQHDLIGSPFRVRILLDDEGEDDLDLDDDEDDAEVLAPDDDDDDVVDDEPLRAKRVVLASADGTTSDDVLYFKVKSGAHGLKAGQRVGVRLVEPGSDTLKKVVPYSAIIYDVQGNAWVYTSPDSLVFIRQRVDIEHIDQQMAVLREGPDIGIKVVTVGAAELLGAESGVGH
jgi:hypothetical protein